jgi:hypothetical protein
MALPALAGYNVSFFVDVALRRAKCEKSRTKSLLVLQVPREYVL